MALPSTIYRVNIQLSDIDRSVYESIQTTVARHPSETEERLVARLLALALFHEEGLQFTRGICVGDEPDLWSKDPGDRVLTWIEVGLPEAERLLKAARHSGQVCLLACGNALSNWEKQQLPKLAQISNLTMVTLDPDFLRRLISLLDRNITWEITITEGTLYLQAAGESLETPLQFRMKPR